MRWSEWLRDYFSFTRKERIGLLVLVLVILLIWISPKMIAPKARSAMADTSWISVARQLQHQGDDHARSQTDSDNLNEIVYDSPAGNRIRPGTQLFYFDPNTLSFAGWKKLGIPERTIGTIQKYLAKGGHFYKPDDLKKIYGIHPDEFARLEPYVTIETTKVPGTSTSLQPKPKLKPEQSAKYSSVDINTGDTSAFIALPGIGSKLASRIISFRDKLGGFYSVGQVAETYGLPDSTFGKIRPWLKIETSAVRKINVNTATKEELKSHPYIRWNLANAIVEYRNQHGDFSSVEDLKKITVISEEVFAKIQPYLEVK